MPPRGKKTSGRGKNGGLRGNEKVSVAPVVPLNERPGRCRVCAECSFKLKFVNHEMVRECRNCGDILGL
jgi:hypothetical protein